MNNKKLIFSVLVLVLISVIGVVFYQKYTKRIPTVSPIAPEVITAFNKGDLDKSIELADEALKKNPNDISAIIALSISWAQKGSVEFKEKEYGQKSLEYANQALKLDPKNVRAHIAYGYATEVIGNLNGAIESYSKAIEIDASSSEAYVHRGHAYDLSGNIAQAEADYTKANSLDGSNLDAIMNLGRLYARQGKSVEAQKEFLTVASSSENNRMRSEAYYDLSFIALQSTSTEALDNAFAYASSSVSIDPTYPQAYVALGNVYRVKGDSKKALELLNKALSMYPNLSYAFNIIANIYAKEGNVDLAIQNFEAQKKAAVIDVGLMDNDRSNMISEADFTEVYTYSVNNRKAEAVNKLKEMITNSKTPASDVGLLIAMANDGRGSGLANISKYKPFQDLLKQLQDKIKAGYKNSQNPPQPTSFLQKLLGFMEVKKAEAVVENVARQQSCGTTDSGGIVYVVDEGSNPNLKYWACAILMGVQSANPDAIIFNGPSYNFNFYGVEQHVVRGNTYTLEDAEWYLNKTITGWDTGVYSFSPYKGYAMFVGCGNGYGAAYYPPPPAPTSATASCSSDGTHINFSWVHNPGYPLVNITSIDYTIVPRVNVSTTNPDPKHAFFKTFSNINNYSNEIQPGDTYQWWARSVDVDLLSHQSISGQITCGATTTATTTPPVTSTTTEEAGFSLSCSANPVPINTSVTYTVTPSGYSGSVNYTWASDSRNSSNTLTKSGGYSTAGIYSENVSASDSSRASASTICQVTVGGCNSDHVDGEQVGSCPNLSEWLCVNDAWATSSVPCDACTPTTFSCSQDSSAVTTKCGSSACDLPKSCTGDGACGGASCTLDGITLQSGQHRAFYTSRIAQICTGKVLYCDNGNFKTIPPIPAPDLASFKYRSCISPKPSEF